MTQKASSPAEVILTRNLAELKKAYPNITPVFPNPERITTFRITIVPAAGIWHRGKFEFEFVIPRNWPHAKPKVTILTKTWHPNLTEDGAVCVSNLREGYTPAVSITNIVTALYFLFQQPNPDSPLNFDAAEQFKSNYPAFKVKAEEYVANYCPK